MAVLHFLKVIWLFSHFVAIDTRLPDSCTLTYAESIGADNELRRLIKNEARRRRASKIRGTRY